MTRAQRMNVKRLRLNIFENNFRERSKYVKLFIYEVNLLRH